MIAEFYYWAMPMLANAGADPDPLISGNWLIAVIGAIASAAAMFWGKHQGKKEATETKITNQPIRIHDESPSATQDELRELKEDIDKRLQKIEQALTEERAIARTANGNIHARIDKQSETMAEMKGELHQVAANVRALLDISMKRNAGGRA